MEPIATFTAEQVAASVISEAIDEVTGESSRRWGLVVVAAVIGAAVVWYVMKRRREAATAESAAP